MLPENLDVLVLWARAQVATGQHHAALRALYDVAERNRGKRSPALANVYREIAKAHLASDELAEALDALDFGFAVDWRVGDLAMLLGLVALDLGEDKVAVRAFSAVTTLPAEEERRRAEARTRRRRRWRFITSRRSRSRKETSRGPDAS